MGDAKKIKNILFIGPITNFHGQGFVTMQALTALKNSGYKVILIDTFSSHHLYKVINNIFILIKIIINLIFNSRNISAIYFTPSRNISSSIRDFFILGISRFKLFLFKKELFIVSHLHGSDLYEFLNENNIYRKILKNLYHSQISKMIILSKSHSLYALGTEFNKYIIIDNPINMSDFPVPVENKQVGKVLQISFVSNPDSTKGLLESINWIKNNIRNSLWKFNVIGWTKDDFFNTYSEYENRVIEDITADKNINFLGSLYGEDKFKILQSSNLFIFLSNYKSEAQPISVIEAIYFKNVVLLSDFKMLNDFSIYNSVLIDNNDIKEDKILNLINRTTILNDSLLKLKEIHSDITFNKKIVECFNVIR